MSKRLIFRLSPFCVVTRMMLLTPNHSITLHVYISVEVIEHNNLSFLASSDMAITTILKCRRMSLNVTENRLLMGKEKEKKGLFLVVHLSEARSKMCEPWLKATKVPSKTHQLSDALRCSHIL